VRRAEGLGYRAVYVDGDVSQIPSLGDTDVLDGWTVTTALLACTESIEIGSIRLVNHWHPARLAQAVATLERIAPGRLRFLISIGGQQGDRRFGLEVPPARDRVDWLDETLAAVRALWRGEEVTSRGRFFELRGARVRPVLPAGRPRVAVAGRGTQLLKVVAAHADEWDINLPPIRRRVEAATADLARACRELGRAPSSISRTMWVFTRPWGDTNDAALRAEFRRLNPWHQQIPDEELPEAMVTGSPARCRERLAEIAERFDLELPVADLSGLDHDAAQRALDALAPGAEAELESRFDPAT